VVALCEQTRRALGEVWRVEFVGGCVSCLTTSGGECNAALVDAVLLLVALESCAVVFS
jgi:hypothetical protein